METLNRQTSLFIEEPSTFSQEDSHANLIPWQAKGLAKMTRDTFFQTCYEPLMKSSQHGSWAKTFVVLLAGTMGWYSRRRKLTWKHKVTKYNRSYFLLQVSTHPISETDSGLLLTPTTKQVTQMLPTPRTTDVEGGAAKNVKGNESGFYRENAKGERWGVKLRDVAESNLIPTPTARCHNAGTTKERPQGQPTRRSELNHLMAQEAGKTSQLNPLFVEEMMGFPENWTLSPFLNGEKNPSKDMETLSSHKSPTESSSP